MHINRSLFRPTCHLRASKSARQRQQPQGLYNYILARDIGDDFKSRSAVLAHAGLETLATSVSGRSIWVSVVALNCSRGATGALHGSVTTLKRPQMRSPVTTIIIKKKLRACRVTEETAVCWSTIAPQQYYWEQALGDEHAIVLSTSTAASLS